MPAARPRMQVTPSETAHRLLAELSRLTGQAPATITRELLDEAVPALEMAIEALREIKKRPDQVQAAMSRFSARAIRDLTQAQLDLDKALEGKRGPKPKKAAAKAGPKKRGRGAANTG